MARFLYYVPGVSGIDADGLKARGRAYLFDGKAQPVSRVEVNRGPDNASGVVAAIGNAGPDLGYYQQRQKWLPSLDGKTWLGWCIDQPMPAPEDLQRAEMMGVYQAELGDGRQWIIPTAIMSNGETPLPKARKLEADGSIRRVVVEKYQSLFLAADLVASHIRTRENISDAEEWRICVEALSVNYRVGPQEVSALQLLTDRSISAIYYCLCDVKNWAKES